MFKKSLLIYGLLLATSVGANTVITQEDLETRYNKGYNQGKIDALLASGLTVFVIGMIVFMKYDYDRIHYSLDFKTITRDQYNYLKTIFDGLSQEEKQKLILDNPELYTSLTKMVKSICYW